MVRHMIVLNLSLRGLMNCWSTKMYSIMKIRHRFESRRRSWYFIKRETHYILGWMLNWLAIRSKSIVELLLILLMLGSLKTWCLKCRPWLDTLRFLLIDVITRCLRYNSLMIHYLGLSYVLLRLIYGLINVHLFAFVFQWGSGYLFTKYGLRLAHRILILWLKIVVDILADLLLGSLLLISFMLEILKFLLIILDELHAVPISLPNFLNLIRINLHMIQDKWFNSRVIFLH